MAKIDRLIEEVKKIERSTLEKNYCELKEYEKKQLRGVFNNGATFYDLEDEQSLNDSKRENYYRQLDSSLYELGLDSLAWYLPYHIYPDEWGIYIPVESIAYIAEKHLGGNTPDDLQMAFKMLLFHEQYHYMNENLISRWELRLGNPCYIFNKQRPYNYTEELLANAYMLKKMSKIKKVDKTCIEKMKIFCKRMPKGYRDFEDAKSKDDKYARELKLIKQYIGVSTLTINKNFPWNSEINLDYDPMNIRQLQTACRVFILRKKRSIAFDQLGFITNIEDLNEDKKFKRNVEKYGLVTKWEKIKNQLENNISSARDFKKFPPAGKNIFSIRIDKSNRVHLRNDGHRWTAIDIGPHTKMGHG